MLASELVEQLQERIETGGDRGVEYNGVYVTEPIEIRCVMPPDEDEYEGATITLL